MPAWNDFLEEKLSPITRKLKAKRVTMFIEALNLGPSSRILDLGSEDGSYLGSYYPYPKQITIADIAEAPMIRGVKAFGLGGYKVIPPDGRLPFGEGEFDAVWCNSVIEHVTVSRQELATLGETEFFRLADEHQRFFANEIRRVGKSYFVQTPNKHFLIESHAWMPIVQYLPQPLRWKVSRLTRTIWIKQWIADYNLYDKKRFLEHFPEANIRVERVLGLPKAFIATRAA